MQDERSQHLNKSKALRILRSKVYEEKRRRIMQEHNDARSAQIGSGDRLVEPIALSRRVGFGPNSTFC